MDLLRTKNLVYVRSTQSKNARQTVSVVHAVRATMGSVDPKNRRLCQVFVKLVRTMRLVVAVYVLLLEAVRDVYKRVILLDVVLQDIHVNSFQVSKSVCLLPINVPMFNVLRIHSVGQVKHALEGSVKRDVRLILIVQKDWLVAVESVKQFRLPRWVNLVVITSYVRQEQRVKRRQRARYVHSPVGRVQADLPKIHQVLHVHLRVHREHVVAMWC